MSPPARPLPASQLDSQYAQTPAAALHGLAPALSLRTEAQAALVERLDHATRLWKLSPRLAEILMLLVAGLSNKEMASCRQRSEVTIEYHVTALLRRAGVETRSRLVAKFWLGLGE